jgi:hypothetical protein
MMKVLGNADISELEYLSDLKTDLPPVSFGGSQKK